ncbi:hypothetical protein AALB16_02915 [Lachnospiraceae bacterium 62-35]
MIDLNKWIDSPDIAIWLSGRPPLDLAEQIDCILSAPHRSLEEKLDGLQRLREEAGRELFPKSFKELELLEKKIDMVETVGEIIYHGGGLRNLYETDIFCCGCKEEFLEKRIFTTPGAGIDFIKEKIKEAADRYEIDTGCFFGVLRKFYRRGCRYMEHEWNIILNPEGKILYCLPETADAIGRNDYWIGPGDYHYLKLPYPSGTVVEMVSSPFFRQVKGVVVNRIEPWEEGFAQDDEQWFLYPDFLHSSDTEIGVIPLNDYASITFGADFVLPFSQFLRQYEGALSEREAWIGEMGELIQKDKSCFGMILGDRHFVSASDGYEKSRKYVKELSERSRKNLTCVPTGNEPNDVFVQAFGECRDGQGPRSSIANLLPRCMPSGF